MDKKTKEKKTRAFHKKICNILTNNYEEHIRVLDFGGRDGCHYEEFKGRLNNHHLEWNIVEIPSICKKHKHKKHLSYYESIEEAPQVDVVYSKSSLHYSLDYKKTLTQLASLKPHFMFFHVVPVGDHDTVLVQQTNKWAKTYGGYGAQQNMQFWFMNETEFTSHMQELGYEKKFKTFHYNHPCFKPLEHPLNGKPDSNSFIFKRL